MKLLLLTMFWAAHLGMVAAATFVDFGPGECSRDGRLFDRYEKDLTTAVDHTECQTFCVDDCHSYHYRSITKKCSLNYDAGHDALPALAAQGFTKVPGDDGTYGPPNGFNDDGEAQLTCYVEVTGFTPPPSPPACDNNVYPVLLCTSTGDPHIKPFLATSQIHPQDEGDFVLFSNNVVSVAARHSHSSAWNNQVVSGNTAVAIAFADKLIEIYSRKPEIGRFQDIVMLNGVETTWDDLCYAIRTDTCGCNFIDSTSTENGKDRFVMRLSQEYLVRVDFAHPTYGWLNIYVTADASEIQNGPDGFIKQGLTVESFGICDDATQEMDLYRFGADNSFNTCQQDPFSLDKDQYCIQGVLPDFGDFDFGDGDGFEGIAVGDRRRAGTSNADAAAAFQQVIDDCDPVLKQRAEQYCQRCDNPDLVSDRFDACIHDACVDVSTGVSSAAGEVDACFQITLMITDEAQRDALCLEENLVYDSTWGLCLSAADLGMVGYYYVGPGFCVDGNNQQFPRYTNTVFADNEVECSEQCAQVGECHSFNFIALANMCTLLVDAGVTVPGLEPDWTYVNVGSGTAPVAGYLATTSTRCFAKTAPTPSPTEYCPNGSNSRGCCPDPQEFANAPGGICVSCGDPHIYQFSRQTGHSFTEGDMSYYSSDRLSLSIRQGQNGHPSPVAGNIAIHLTGDWLDNHSFEYHGVSQFGIVRSEPELRWDGQLVTWTTNACDLLEEYVCVCRYNDNYQLFITFDNRNALHMVNYKGWPYGYMHVHLMLDPLDFASTDDGMCTHGDPPATTDGYASYTHLCADDPFTDANRNLFCANRRREDGALLLPEPEGPERAAERRRQGGNGALQTLLTTCQTQTPALHAQATTDCAICGQLSQGQLDACVADACALGTANGAQLMIDGCLTTVLLMTPPNLRPNVCPAGYAYEPTTISCELDCGNLGSTPRGCCPAVVRPPPSTSRCTSTGDPHIRGFDGSYNHAYTNGDYYYYKGTELTVVGRHATAPSGVAGNAGLLLTGEFLNHHVFEFYPKMTVNNNYYNAAPFDNNGVLRNEHVFKLDGVVMTIAQVCTALEPYTCKCGMVGSTLIMSFDEYTQVKAQVWSTTRGWFNLYLQLDPAIQNPTDTGICTYSGNEWSNAYHRIASAYIDYRLDCTEDQTTVDKNLFCVSCNSPNVPNSGACRRRFEEDVVLRRPDGDNCNPALENTIEAACQPCAADQNDYDSCVFDGCAMDDIAAAQAAGESCFQEDLLTLTIPERGQMCRDRDADTFYDEQTQSCVTTPNDYDVRGFQFMGYGYCLDDQDETFSFYQPPNPITNVKVCGDECNEAPECLSFEFVSDTMCLFNLDAGISAPVWEAQKQDGWTGPYRRAGVHPVTGTTGHRGAVCLAKSTPSPTSSPTHVPSAAPTPDCPNPDLGFSSLGCCPATVLNPPATSKCHSWGDPHVVQFNGVQNHGYTEGDYILYKGDQLEVVERHAHCGATNGVTGNNGIAISGALLGGHTIEFLAQTTNENIRPAGHQFLLDGMLKSPEAICSELESYVCKCALFGNNFVLSFDEFTQVKANVFNTAYGWMDIYLQLNPTLQNWRTDTGMCTHTGAEWTDFGHRDATAYLDYRTDCTTDPFTDTLRPEFCGPCLDSNGNACRRRTEENQLRRRQGVLATCDVTLKANAENLCQQCPAGHERDGCVYDTCAMGMLLFAEAAANRCFDQALCAEPDFPTRRQMCHDFKGAGFQYYDGPCECAPIPQPEEPGYDFLGWGKCRDSDLAVFPYYEIDGTATCADECNDHAECKSVTIDSINDKCFLNVDHDAQAIAPPPGTFVDNLAAASPHPVYQVSATQLGFTCLEKQPTPAPTVGCPTGQSTVHGGCCPAAVPALAGPGLCVISGDPHVRQFTGDYGDIYVDGDFRVYKNNEIEVSQRSGLVIPNYTRAGHVALRVEGSVLGGNSIEIINKNWHPSVGTNVQVPTTVVKYNGQPSTLAAICQDLLAQDLVCMCIASPRLFLFSIGEKYLVRQDIEVSSLGWSNLYFVADTSVQSPSDTGVCARTGNRVQDGGANNVDPYSNDRYTCANDPFTDNLKSTYCLPPDQAGVPYGRRRSSPEEILADCPPALRSKADEKCGAGCDDVPDLDSANCVIDICALGDLNAGSLELAGCLANAIAVAAPEDKESFCEADESYSKELDTCLTEDEIEQVLEVLNPAPVGAPTARPTFDNSGSPGENNVTPDSDSDEQDEVTGTTVTVMAIFIVGMLVLFALGIMIGQRFAAPRSSPEAAATTTVIHTQAAPVHTSPKATSVELQTVA